jgi:pilus assembly protein CpaF
VREDPDLVDRVRHRLANVAGDVPSAVRRESMVLADDLALADLSRSVAAQLSGAGPLEPLLALPGVTDVLVNAPDDVWIDQGHGLVRVGVGFADDGAVRRLAQRLAAAAGRRLDDATPFVDAALADGTRLHAALPPLTSYTTLSLRVLARRRFTLAELVGPPERELLQALVAARMALLISGGTGTGKTTLLGALLGCVPDGERLVIIEDAAELVIAHPHVVRLTTRAPNIEGAGAIGLADLVRQALRMRPDRLIVGEFRGAELVELLAALNTGHEGGAATVHANSAADVPARLTALGALGGLSAQALVSQAVSALDVVIALRRDRAGRRYVDEIGLLSGELTVATAWSTRDGPGPAAGRLAELLHDRDVGVPAVLA